MRSWFALTAVLFSMAVVTGSAYAVPLSGAASKFAPAMADKAAVELVQYRHGGPRPGPRHGPYRGHDRGGDGGAVAAGVLGGLLLGAIIANQAQQQNSVDYCMQRYRSYDPRSGTYVGYDGRRHRCP
ncbi:MAG: BA14K family protein [Pseudolabrys sp.]|jgi:hypothetical protein